MQALLYQFSGGQITIDIYCVGKLVGKSFNEDDESPIFSDWHQRHLYCVPCLDR